MQIALAHTNSEAGKMLKVKWENAQRVIKKHNTSYILLMIFMILTVSNSSFAENFNRGLEAFRAGDHQQAFKTWQPLAISGNANAQHALGKMYEYGRGLKQDDLKAANWYLKAAKQDMPDAQYRLGVLHENGWGVTQDPILAAQWYKQAAKLNHTLAQHDLAIMFLNGAGVPKNRIHAYKWLKIASMKRADLMTKHLLNVSKTMTASEIEKAEILVSRWLNAKKI